MLLTTVALMMSALMFANTPTTSTPFYNESNQVNGGCYYQVSVAKTDFADFGNDSVTLVDIPSNSNVPALEVYCDSGNHSVNDEVWNFNVSYAISLSSEPVNLCGYVSYHDTNNNFTGKFYFDFLDYKNQGVIYQMEFDTEFAQAGANFVFDIYCFLETQTAYQMVTSDMGGYYDSGYQAGYEKGQEINQEELDRLTQTAYESGFYQGQIDGIAHANDYSFSTLFGAIADTPVLIIRNLFNFDFFGVNLLTVVLSLFTALILFYLLRKIL